MKFLNSITLDSYGNNLKKRITFINIPNELYKLDDFSLDNKIIQNKNSIKVLKLINETETDYKFHIINEEKTQKKIEYDKLELELINLFYSDYNQSIDKLKYDNYNIEKDIKNLYHNLFYGKEIIKKFIIYIKEGFENYIYENNEKDYLFIKKLCFAIIYYIKKEYDFFSPLTWYISNVKNNYNNFCELEFIDRIKFLITLTNRYISKNKDENCNYDIVCIENEIPEKYEYIRIAHKLLIEIINGLTEKSLLFQTIHHFNSLIYDEINTHKEMYSGSILNVDDIKLEIYKNLNIFYLTSLSKESSYGSINKNTKVIILNPHEFGANEETIKYINKDEIQKRKLAAVLIILFYELGEHLKTHINNFKDSPLAIYLSDLKVENLNLIKNDSGFMLEYLFTEGTNEVKNFVNSENSVKLLNKNIYLGKNFNKLKEILKSIKDNIANKTKSKPDLIKKLSSEDIIPKSDNNRIFRENYKDLNYSELSELLSKMDDKALKENKDIYDYYISKFFSDPNTKY